MTRAVAAVALCAAAAAHAQPAASQAWPQKPVRVIAPFSPGGGADGLARALTRRLQDGLGQPFVIEYRGGASGIIGTEIAAKAAPDGYTLIFVMTPHLINPAIRKLPFDPIADFEPVSLFAGAPFMLVAHPSLPVKSVADLIALARRKPGAIDYASTGIGSTPHLAAEMFATRAGIKLHHVSYKGVPGAIADVLGGGVALTFLGPAGVMPHVGAGRLRVLATTSAKRSPTWPDVPTIGESGVKDYDFVNWYGLLAPRGTPKAVISRLHAEIARSAEDAEFRQSLAASGGAELYATGPEEFRKFMEAERAKFRQLVATLGGLKAD